MSRVCVRRLVVAAGGWRGFLAQSAAFHMSKAPTIIYTQTDEAPALATYSLLPIVQAFAKHAGVNVETRDISLSGRILAVFSSLLPEAQRVPDSLAELGALTL